MPYVFDHIARDALDIEIDDRGVAHIDAITLRQGPMRYLRPGGARWENVSEEQVKLAMNTAGAAPITDGHPPDLLNIDIIGNHTQGLSDTDVSLVEIESDDPDEPDRLALMQHLMVHDRELIKAIDEGKKQISTGRKVDFKHSPGQFAGVEYEVEQVNTRINHIAIVESGRCGQMCSILPEEAQVEDPESAEGQHELDPEVEECVQSVKEEGESKENAIAICQEQVGDRGTFRNRIMSIMDPMEASNAELIERVGRIVKRDPEEVQRVINENETEPSISIVNALGQVLGIKQSRVQEWARQEWGEAVFEETEDNTDDRVSNGSDETFDSDQGKGRNMEIEIAGTTYTLDVCECEDDELIDTLEEIEDHANKAVADLTSVLDEVKGGSDDTAGASDEEPDDADGDQDQATDMSLASMLKKARQEQSMELEALAEEVPTTPQTLQMIESGEAPLPEDLAVELAGVLELEVEDLIKAIAGESQKSSNSPESPESSEMGETEGGTHKEGIKGMDSDDSPDSDTDSNDNDMGEATDEKINLVSDIKTLDDEFDYEDQSVHDLKIKLLEELKGESLDEMDEDVAETVRDSEEYTEGLIDAEITRRQNQSEQETAEDEQQEKRPKPGSGSNGTEPVGATDSDVDPYVNPDQYFDDA